MASSIVPVPWSPPAPPGCCAAGPCKTCYDAAKFGGPVRRNLPRFLGMMEWLKRVYSAKWYEEKLSAEGQQLENALRANDTETVKALIDSGRVSVDGNYSAAAHMHYLAMECKDMTNLNFDVYDHPTPLMCAVQHTYIDLIKWLIAKGANLDAVTREFNVHEPNDEYGFMAPAKNALIYAAECKITSDGIDVLKLLMDAGADPNILCHETGTVLHRIACLDKVAMLQALLAYDNVHMEVCNAYNEHEPYHPVENRYESVPHTAVVQAIHWHRQSKCATMLLEKGSDVNFVDKHCTETPLMALTEPYRQWPGEKKDRSKILKLPTLVEFIEKYHADPNVVASNGNTLLHKASAELDIKIFKYILGLTKDSLINLPNKDGIPPLVLCFNLDPWQNMTEDDIVQKLTLLLRRGADPSVIIEKDGVKNCALVYAIKNGYFNLLRYLVEWGTTEERFIDCMETQGPYKRELMDVYSFPDFSMMGDPTPPGYYEFVKVERKQKSIIEACLKLARYQRSGNMGRYRRVLGKLGLDVEQELMERLDAMAPVSSLLHETRCVLRAALIKNGTFKQALVKMPWPTKVKELIQFRVI